MCDSINRNIPLMEPTFPKKETEKDDKKEDKEKEKDNDNLCEDKN